MIACVLNVNWNNYVMGLRGGKPPAAPRDSPSTGIIRERKKAKKEKRSAKNQ